MDKANLPAGWKNPVACVVTAVSYVPSGVALKVTAMTTQTLSVGGEDFPADDQIAWFKVWYPWAYDFVRHYKFNPECCPDRPGAAAPVAAGAPAAKRAA